MKKITYLYILLLAVVFSACEDEAEKVFVSSNPVAPSLTGPGADGLQFVLADKNSSIEFTWDESDFGFAASVNYMVEVSTDDTFENKIQVLSGEGTNATAIVDDVNSALLGLGLVIDEAATVQMRVIAAISADVDTLISTPVAYSVTPYETIYPAIYVPGAYQGWSPGAENGRLYSYAFNSVYQGILRIVEGANPSSSFKITPEADWDEAWGGTLAADGSKFSGALDPSGGDFSVAAGTYIVTADIGALTLSLEKTDDWGIIGSSTAGGWDNDTDLEYNGQRQVWQITTDLVDGALKFRANDGWDLNYGDTGADGIIEAGGDDIAVSAGNYTIIFDLINEKYELVAN